MTASSGQSVSGAAEPSSISSTLLEQIRRQRPDAWNRLVDLYGPVVYRWCRQLGVASADAADVVQEVFAAVAGGLRLFHRDRSRDSFGAWLRTITRRKVGDYFRRRQGRPTAEGGTTAYQHILNVPQPREASNSRSVAAPRAEMPAADVPLELDGRFTHRALEVVRAEFEPRTWEAFWRLVVNGQTPATVATDLGLSLPAVYKAKSRVLQRLRRELHDS